MNKSIRTDNLTCVIDANCSFNNVISFLASWWSDPRLEIDFS